MKLLAFAVLAVVVVVASAHPSVWWNGHGAVDPGATVVGPSGSIHVGPSSAGAVIPGAGWHGGWAWGPWAHHGAWGHHGLWW